MSCQYETPIREYFKKGGKGWEVESEANAVVDPALPVCHLKRTDLFSYVRTTDTGASGDQPTFVKS